MRRHLTYSNVIASLALFIALGGISWAAATAPRNSVASKSIKKKAVTNSKIRNNAITSRKIKTGAVISSDVKNNALTGADINEGTLGTVPSASSAASATTAGTATDQISVLSRVNSSAANSDPAIARAQAAEVQLASHGAVSLYAKCFNDSDDGRVYAEIYARTSANGATLTGNVDDPLRGGPALNAGTLEVDRAVTAVEDLPNGTDYDYLEVASLIGPDGLGMQFDASLIVRAGNPADPPGYLQSAASCGFQVSGSKGG